jgi:hypothetical protein
MSFDAKQRANETVYALTAENVMDRNCLTIPEKMLVREAACLLRRKRTHVAAVVDENGRCTGMLRAADVFGQIEASCPNVPVGAGPTCPYQVRGRLLNGADAVICTLAHGRCAFQVEQPTTGGRHTDVCARQETAALPYPNRTNRIATIVMKEPMRRSEGESVAGGMLRRLAAFSTDPDGGNPAGVWIGETPPKVSQTQATT